MLIGERGKKLQREHGQERGGGGGHCCDGFCGCSGCDNWSMGAEEGAAAETNTDDFKKIR